MLRVFLFVTYDRFVSFAIVSFVVTIYSVIVFVTIDQTSKKESNEQIIEHIFQLLMLLDIVPICFLLLLYV